MWLKVRNNFGVDVYIKMANKGDELVLDTLPANHEIINDVLATENVDSFNSMTSGFLHIFLRSFSREAP